MNRWQTEFPNYPVEDMPAIPATWDDVSWHNDACPCFQVGEDLYVYVDYNDQETREFSDVARFQVNRYNEDKDREMYSVLETDDWDEVLKCVRETVNG